MTPRHRSNPELSPKKRALLENLIRSEGLESSVSQTIPAGGAREWSALSFAQKRLWFINELEPNSPVYNDYFSLRIKGQVNVATLQQCIDEIINRHDSLRTTFKVVGGEPAQVIASSTSFKLQTVDLSNILQSTASVSTLELAVEEARRPFNLERGPLLRMTLLQTASDEGLLLFTIHHIISDGWSLGVLIKELTTLYEAYSLGAQSALSELPIQYGDFAEWHKKWVEETVLKSQLPYWKKKLANAPSMLELPFDHPRPAARNYSGCKVALDLPSHLNLKLKQYSRQKGTTKFMVLVAAFKALLYRYTGQGDILIGLPIAGRNRSETEELIGLFTNLLALRTEVSGALSFEECLGRCKETAVSAFAHQDVPFELLVEELNPERGLSYNPVFQVLFALQNAPAEELKLPRVKLQRIDIDAGTTKFDLTLDFIDTEEELKGSFEYNTDLFELETIERMCRHYQNLLGEVLERPQCRVMELPLMSEQERQEVIVEWNRTDAEYPRDRCVHELFEQQVELTPDSVAVVYEGEQLSYHELDRRANQLARCLRERGVGAEVKVGLCVERSLEMIVGLLGVMKAGGAYLPLDPDYPQERLAYMIKDAECRIILCKRHHLEKLSETETTLLRLDVDWGVIALHSDVCLAAQVTADNLAYVIYTSGSTGKPKGVAVEQRNIVKLVRNVNYAELNAQEVFLQFAPVSFDASTFEIWGCLLNGGRLVVCSSEFQSLEQLGRVLREHQVSTAWFTAGLFQQVVDERIEDLKGLRQILAGGEALSVPHVLKVLAELPGCRLINGYGPTECTTFSSTCTMTEPGELVNSVPIGHPITNTQIYILSENQEPAPVGVTGEIYIAGLGLARSYVNRADETAEKFIADPFGAEGSRMYRTGDLGRYRRDGSIECLGRVDDQVKIRGYRIELGEIEAVLNEHPYVSQVSVLAREDEPGEKRLVGYVVSRQQVSSQELREYLQERLPDYMAPGAIVQLEAMPLTPNGKLDRRALPKPELNGAGRLYVGPRTAVEEIVCGIWAEVLRVEKVGIYDNFFELGGHSLLATQVVSRMRNLLRVEAPLRSLFTHPTTAAIAAEIEQQQRSGGEAPVEAIVKVARERDLPLSYAQQRLWFIDQLEPGSATYNIPCAVRLSGRIDADALRKSFNEIIARHEALRTSFPSRDGEPRQEIHQFSGLQPDFLDLMRSDEAERQEKLQEVLRDEAGRGFDLSRGPLIRAKLIRLAEDRHVLIVNMHHIVSDGWSMEIIIREFAQLYEAFTQGREFSLPELEIQYADYAVWQRGWLQGEVLDTQLQYWRRQLEGVAALELPTDRARPAVADYRGSSERVALSGELTEKLRQMSRQEGVTLFMSLLAGFQFLLARYSGQDDIAVGTPISGRNRRELEGLIGFFVNTLVMRVDLGGARTVSELLGRVRETALEAYAHQDLPFEKLVEELQPERSLSRTPLFQVMFAFQNAPFSVRQPGSLLAEVVDVEVSTAKFDITLTLNDGGERLTGAVVYNSDLFDASTIKRMIEYYECLLEGIVSDTTQPLQDLPRVTESEKKQLLLDWNDTGADYDPEICIHEMIEGQAGAMPDAIAVVFADQRISYGELDRRTNQAGNFLRRRGIGPETRVGLMLERSIELVVWMIGILKAGGAYVPIDAGFPAERIGFMLEDAEVKLLLMEPEILEWRPVNQVQVVPLDRGLCQIATESEEPLPVKATSRNLAYAIYTSGSTGYPKGVAVSHQEVSNFFTAMDGYLEPEPGAVWLAVTGIAFDISVLELLWTLSRGIQVVIQGDWRSAQPTSEEEKKRFERSQIVWQEEDNSIMAQITRRQVSHLQCTPSLARALCEWSDSVTQYSSLSKLLIGGEAFPVGLAANLKQLVRGEIRNMYGPTETTIWSTTHALNGEESSIPIGRPIANTRGYVLDGDLGLVPVGAAGELCLGGKGVVRGYLNRSELTAERFLPDEYGTEAGGRIYRTGDLVRYQADGKLEFLGRIDHQVKIRGMRIELGEIEVQQNTHPGISESVVTAGENEVGEKQLVSYFVGRAEGAPSANELRDYLKERLPEYLVPSLFVELEKLPLTANGKLDRRALPKPEQSGGCGEYVGPRSAVEEIVCGIWEEVLRVEKVGIYDNFFDLGGHSLLATQVVSRVRSALGVEVPLRVQFSNQTVAAFAAEVELRQRRGGEAAVEGIGRVARNGELPLSYAQQRLWFIDQLEPGNAGYNIPCALRVRGDLRQVLLERVLSEVVRRHEVLRTRFEVRDDQPVQVIEEAMLVSAPVIDVSGLEEEQREREASRVLNEEAARSFDLSRGPLIRAVMVRLGEQEQIVLLTMHHIVSDEWSSGVLIREVSALYEAYSKGEASPLPELPIQYADYAVWQREWLQGDAVDEQIGYWRDKLKEMETHVLPTDRPRSSLQSNQLARESIVLSQELTDSVRALSRREGVTIFMLLLSVFKTLLHRYTGETDLPTGSLIANRNRWEIEGLIGFFVNTLVLRTDLSGDPPFRDLLGRVRQVALEAYAHQELPFERLVEELQPERSLSRTPLFQVMFILQNAPLSAIEIEGLQLRNMEIERRTANFDLVLSLGEAGDRLSGLIDYKKELFDRDRIERLAGHLEVMLAEVVKQPGQRLSQLTLLAESEQRQLVEDWNRSNREYGPWRSVTLLIAEQAELRGEALAVECEGHALSYAELNWRASQLASYLRRREVGPEHVVGVAMRRSVDLVVSLLAILKAGGAYLPLDNEYPIERIRYMLSDAGVRVLLSESGVSREEWGYEGEVLCLDEEWEQVSHYNNEDCNEGVSEENLAYVIYTSGSTGRPKAAMNTHRGLYNRLMWMQDAYHLDETDCVLQKTPFSFDVSVWEFFWPLMTGAKLAVARPDGHKDSGYLVKAIEDYQVTTLHFVPSMLRVFLEEQKIDWCKSVKRVICSGEALSVDLQRMFFDSLDAELFNLYGPTEASIDVTHWACHANNEQMTVPIGRPIANTQIHLLDKSLRLVPIGIAGELCIGGAGLGRGYLSRADLTAERFIPDPFSQTQGQRLYKTGDLSRYLRDGSIDFLGRLDHQVKIRGIRIELGEIDAVLKQHPSVSDSAVVATGDAHGDRRLIAYIVTARDQALTVEELRNFVKDKLPEYMAPATFVFMQAMPLTSSGKLDRRRLPASDDSQTESRKPYVAPRTPIEEEMASIWQELLKKERVGIYDNFFEEGGHSLLLTQLASRIRKTFDIEVPLRVLFDAPTIVEVTKAIVERQINRLDSHRLEEMVNQLRHLSPPEIRALLEYRGQNI